VGERQDNNNAGGVLDRVTIAEAATLLGCHPNTVRSRVRAGIYDAEKVVTERGPTWMIDRDSLTTSTPTSASQLSVSGVPAAQQEALQELARQIVREADLQQSSKVDDRKRAREKYIEAGREFFKAQIEFFKHIGTLSAATVVAVPAVIRGIVNNPEMLLVYLSMGLLLLALFLSFVGMVRASRRLGDFAWRFSPEMTPDNLAEMKQDVLSWSRFYDYFRFAIYMIYTLGLGFFFGLLLG
jgi:hypothetical protein